MQTIFRWSHAPSGETALADKVLSGYQQKSRQKPRADFPLLNISKRKRSDGLEVASHNAPQVKKVKAADPGAVQPALEPARGVDAPPGLDMVHAGAQSDGSSKSMASTVTSFVGPVNDGEALEGVEKPARSVSNMPDQSHPPTGSSTPAAVPLPQLPLASASTTATTTTDETDTMTPEARLGVLRAVIEAQINLEVLHKHQELRLIEQELAKCQIGLEQLRRCEVIPYPGTQGPSLAVSSGVGASLASPEGYTSPSYAAPWGATDGPYTRHYAKWLIPDPSFDPMIMQATVGTPLTARGARATRGSGAEPLLPAPPARHSRVSTGSRTSLSGDLATPTMVRDPMIMKRQMDGQWVRLRCNHCHRSNFNNVQGFLNHCRIAHSQGFESHEAAAITCGEIVSVDESHYATEPAPLSRESLARPAVVTVPSDQPLVSPLISKGPIYQPLDRVMTHPYTPEATPQPSPSTTGLFAKACQTGLTPHLNNLMQRRGLSTTGLDIAVRENRKKADLSVYDDSDSDRENHSSKRQKTKKPKSAARHPSSGQFSLPMSTTSTPVSARPSSQKGMRASPLSYSSQPTTGGAQRQHSRPPPLKAFHNAASTFGGDIAQSPTDVEMDLSPGTAADSNPGLVSDHEDDYDDVDEDARSASGSHPGIDGIAVEIEDASDVERDGRKRVRVVAGQGEEVCRREGVTGLGEGSE